MSYYFELDGILYRSYFPGNLRKRNAMSHDQLVIPQALIQSSYDHALSGGHLTYKQTDQREVLVADTTSRCQNMVLGLRLSRHGSPTS